MKDDFSFILQVISKATYFKYNIPTPKIELLAVKMEY